MSFYKTDTKAFLMITNLILFVLAYALTVILGEFVGHEVFRLKYEAISIIGCTSHLIILTIQGIHLLATSEL